MATTYQHPDEAVLQTAQALISKPYDYTPKTTLQSVLEVAPCAFAAGMALSSTYQAWHGLPRPPAVRARLFSYIAEIAKRPLKMGAQFSVAATFGVVSEDVINNQFFDGRTTFYGRFSSLFLTGALYNLLSRQRIRWKLITGLALGWSVVGHFHAISTERELRTEQDYKKFLHYVNLSRLTTKEAQATRDRIRMEEAEAIKNLE